MKIFMVVAVGLAIISFVILPSVEQMGGQVSPWLLIVMFGISLGFVGWAFGTQQEKKTETKGASQNYAFYGLLIGVAIGAAFMYSKTEEKAVYVTGEDLTGTESLTFTELRTLRENRALANQFMADSLREVQTEYVNDLARQILNQRFPGMETSTFIDLFKPQAEMQFQQIVSQPMFFFDRDSGVDAVTAWLLNMEADKMGLVVSDEVVNDFINDQTGKHIDAAAVLRIRSEMSLSNARLFDILRTQIRANMVRTLKQPQRFMTPGEFGKRYRQLNVRQELEIAKIPVNEFLKYVSEPKEAELKEYFEKHKQLNSRSPLVPAYDKSFFQPRKVRIAFLKLSREKVEEEVKETNPVTDEQIKAHYLEFRDTKYRNSLYKEPMPFPDTADDENALMNNQDSDLRYVSYQDTKQDKKSAKKSADKKDAEKKTKQKKTDDKPKVLVQQPPEPPKSEPPPATKYLPFDNAMKDRIRSELRQELSDEVMTKRIKDANDWLKKNVATPYTNWRVEQKAETFTPQSVSDKTKAYALDKDFEYTVTDLLSHEEFTEVGKFELSEGMQRLAGPNNFATNTQGSSSVDILFDPIRPEQDMESNLYRISRSVINSSLNRYLFWKIGDEKSRVPTLDDEGIKDIVIEEWKMTRARELSEDEKKNKIERLTANKRAEQLADEVRKSGKAMSEALKGKTVNGEADSAPIEPPRNTNTFSWKRLTPSIDPGTGRQQGEPQLDDATVTGVVNPPGVGEEFLEIVFEKLEDGEVGVAYNADKTVYYVVRVLNRTPASNEGEQEMLNRFLKEKLFTMQGDQFPTTYYRLQEYEMRLMQQEWYIDFQRRYNIQFTDTEKR